MEVFAFLNFSEEHDLVQDKERSQSNVPIPAIDCRVKSGMLNSIQIFECNKYLDKEWY